MLQAEPPPSCSSALCVSSRPETPREETIEAEPEEKLAVEEDNGTEATLRALINMMPKNTAKELRKAAADVEQLVYIVEFVEKLSEFRSGFGTPLLVSLALVCSIPLAILVGWFGEWQPLALWLTAVIGLTLSLWPFSLPGRIMTGVFYYAASHWRLRARMTHAVHEIAVHDPEALVRMLAKIQTRFLGLHATGKPHKDEESLHGHVLSPTTVGRFAWCSDCGHFLWGFRDQGFHCKACHRVFCPTCAHADNEGVECTGMCETHEYELTTFHHPSWCSACESFLWGSANQGYKCIACNKVVCPDCYPSSQTQSE